MAKISTLIEGYRRFYKSYFVNQPEIYQGLLKGQSPKTLVIACSDSRVDPAIILDTKPGDIFVIRNVANLVPPYEAERGAHHGISAAIEFAVVHLKVENILIMGHTDCGGINTLMNKTGHSHDFVDDWLEIAADAKERALAETANPAHVCEACAKEAIRISLANLAAFPFIKERLGRGDLELQGWYFRLDSGQIDIV